MASRHTVQGFTIIQCFSFLIISFGPKLHSELVDNLDKHCLQFPLAASRIHQQIGWRGKYEWKCPFTQLDYLVALVTGYFADGDFTFNMR